MHRLTVPSGAGLCDEIPERDIMHTLFEGYSSAVNRCSKKYHCATWILVKEFQPGQLCKGSTALNFTEDAIEICFTSIRMFLCTIHGQLKYP